MRPVSVVRNVPVNFEEERGNSSGNKNVHGVRQTAYRYDGRANGIVIYLRSVFFAGGWCIFNAGEVSPTLTFANAAAGLLERCIGPPASQPGRRSNIRAYLWIRTLTFWFAVAHVEYAVPKLGKSERDRSVGRWIKNNNMPFNMTSLVSERQSRNENTPPEAFHLCGSSRVEIVSFSLSFLFFSHPAVALFRRPLEIGRLYL